jgi:hypothetical protein
MRASSPILAIIAITVLVGSIVFFATRWHYATATNPAPALSAAPRPGQTPPPRAVKEQVVRGFYDDVSAGRYASAYERLSPAFHTEEPYPEFVARYAGVERMDARVVDVPGTPAVDVTIVARRRDAAAPPTIFEGPISLAYDASHDGWVIAERHLKRVSGERLGPNAATPTPLAVASNAPATEAPNPAQTAAAANCYTDKIASVDASSHTLTVALGDVYQLAGDTGWTAGQAVSICLAEGSGYELTAGGRTVKATSAQPATAQ